MKAQLDEMVSAIEADPAQLQMVLTAVVANAAEAIEGAGPDPDYDLASRCGRQV